MIQPFLIDRHFMEGGAKENKTNLERGPSFFYAGNPLDNET